MSANVWIRPDKETGTKLCPDCKTHKAFEAFPVRKSGTLYSYCKECNSQRAREWSGKNKDRKAETNASWHAKKADHVRIKARDNHYKRRYGISRDEVLSMLAKQGHRCAICATEVTEATMVVDHCHGSGRVRDILCNLCNISLAPLERVEWVKAALAYLERHRSRS